MLEDPNRVLHISYASDDTIANPCISTKVDDTPCFAFMDSGSNVCLIKKEFLEHLNYARGMKNKPLLEPHAISCTIRGVSGIPVSTLGSVKLNMNLGSLVLPGCFVVVDEHLQFPGEVLLGTPFMNHHKFICDFGLGCVIIHPHNFPIVKPPQPQNRSMEKQTTTSPGEKIKTVASNSIFVPEQNCSDVVPCSTESDARSRQSHNPVRGAQHPTNHSLPHPPASAMSQHSGTASVPKDFNKSTQHPSSMHLIAIEDEVLFAHERTFLSARIQCFDGQPLPEDCQVLIEKGKSTSDPILPAQALCNAANEICPLVLINTSANNLMIRKGQTLATATTDFVDILPFSDSPHHAVEDVLALSQATSTETASHKQTADLNESELRERILSTIQSSSPSPEVHGQLIKLLTKYRSIIAVKGDKLGSTGLVKYHSKLQEGTKPIYTHPYRVPHSQQSRLNKEITEMLDQGIISPSTSPWSSPMILVRKKDGSYRPCADFRKINSATQPDRYPMPNLQETLQSLGKAKYFATMDLFQGFWQIEVDEASKPITAFTTPSGHYEFNVLPFGLRNAPACFSRLMSIVLTGLLGTEALVYLDDIILFGTSATELLTRMENVFQRLEQANLKLKLTKCNFFETEVVYLGHLITPHGIAPDPAKLDALRNYPTPTSVENIQSFIGFVGFYRNFIENFSRIAEPLTAMLKKKSDFIWTSVQQSAFDTLRKKLMTKPILQYPDYDKRFILATDASNYGIGCVLMQETNGKEHPLAYASRLLTKAEKNYDCTDREALALVWSLKKFRSIIYGYEIIVKTDHQALIHIFKGTSPNNRTARWALQVQEFAPLVCYKPGKFNTLPDILSRIHEETSSSPNREQCLLENEDALYIRTCRSQSTIRNWTIAELISAQSSDPDLQVIKKKLKVNLVSNLSDVTEDGYFVYNDVLYKTSGTRDLVVIPKRLENVAIALCHDTAIAGHFGPDRTMKRVAERFSFPHLYTKVKEYCNTCDSCHKYKGAPSKPAPMGLYPIPHTPWERTGMDILGPLPTTSSGNKYVLVFTDHLTRFNIFVPLSDRHATTVAQALYNNVVVPFSTPSVLLCDNAAEFTSKVLTSLCSKMKISKVHIASYHPAANGLVERQNGKILAILRHIIDSDQRNWDQCLPDAQLAINSAYNISVDDTPHYLLFHVDKRLPFDLTQTPVLSPIYSIDDYVTVTSNRAQQVFQKVKESLEISNANQQKLQHNRAKEKPILIGTRCFIKALVQPGKSKKLSPKWKGPFRVMKKIPHNKIEVCNIQTGKLQTVHMDNAKIVPEATIPKTQVPKARTPFGTSPLSQSPLPRTEDDLTDSEDETDHGTFLPLNSHDHHKPQKWCSSKRQIVPKLPINHSYNTRSRVNSNSH